MGAVRRRLTAALAAAALLPLANCLDIAFVADVAFPAAVPGLPTDQPWVSLPIGAWVIESEVEARAISMCVSPECRPQAAIGLFRATGSARVRLAELAGRPDALLRELAERPARRMARRSGPARPVPAASVTVEARREGAAQGFVGRIARPDGSREAAIAALARPRSEALAIVVVIAPTQDAAWRLARTVAPHLSP